MLMPLVILINDTKGNAPFIDITFCNTTCRIIVERVMHYIHIYISLLHRCFSRKYDDNMDSVSPLQHIVDDIYDLMKSGMLKWNALLIRVILGWCDCRVIVDTFGYERDWEYKFRWARDIIKMMIHLSARIIILYFI